MYNVLVSERAVRCKVVQWKVVDCMVVKWKMQY